MSGRRRVVFAKNRLLATPSEPGFRRSGSGAQPGAHRHILLWGVRRMNDRFRQISSFDRQERVGAYRPDRQDEDFLSRLNLALGSFEDELFHEAAGQAHCNILIVAPPRSGSTFLYQKLAVQPDLDYISNLMARFYESPLVGAHLHRMLLTKHPPAGASFESHHGVTPDIWGPHEYGFFFSRFMPFSKDNHEEFVEEDFLPSLQRLDATLKRISGILEKPVVYKCAIAPFVLNQLLSETSVKVIYLRRDPLKVVDSILRVRRERLGSDKLWWSIRPQDWRQLMSLSPEDQVGAQVQRVNDSIWQAIQHHPGRFFELSFEEFQRNEKSFVKQIASWAKVPVSKGA